MNNLNSVLLEGNLVRDPEEKKTVTGKILCHFSIACNRYYKKDGERVQEVSYFEIEAWSGLAEACLKHLCKGRGVRVVGRLKQDRWTDSEEKSQSKVKVIAEQVEFKPVPVDKRSEERAEVF